MARLASQQIAGYYPVPTDLLEPIARTVSIKTLYRTQPLTRLSLLDPCAGDGEALMTLAKIWRAPFTYGVEMEAGRAKALTERKPTRAIASDLFQLTWTDKDYVDLLWLNPPYDQDPDFGRLEQRFLDHTTRALRGGGVLLFLIPITALKASAEHLASHFASLRCWRLPDPHYHVFRQVLVVANKLHDPELDTVEVNTVTEAQVRAWAEDPASIPVLSSVDEPVVLDYGRPRFRDGTDGPFEPTVLPLPVDAIHSAFTNWNPVPDGQDGDLDDLLSPSFPTAAPPRPAHVALALTAGVFNGKRLMPDDPSTYPEILASGHFTKQLRQVGTTTDDEGQVTGIKRLERPNLQITILDLDSYTFHDLAMGAVPSDDPDPEAWTAGDLLKHYHRSLMGHLEEAFPVLHDRRKPEHQVALPQLDRTPYPYQHEAIVTALKLLAEGFTDPMFQAEVGTGKSTLSLILAASLAPGNRPKIVEQLEAQGFERAGDLPTVRKPLVVCPPHLIHSWRDEIAAVLGPGYPVHVLMGLSDIERAAADPRPAILLMARERAKLGHYWSAIGPLVDPEQVPAHLGKRAKHRGLVVCPGCGAPITEKPAALVRKRQRCRIHIRRPLDRWARLAHEIAVVLMPFAPGHEHMARALNARTRANLVPPRDGFPPALSASAESKLIQIASRYQELPDQAGPRELLVSFEHHALSLDAKLRLALDVLGYAISQGRWETRICGEPLFQGVATPRHDAPDPPFPGPPWHKPPKGPRSFPLATYMARRHPRLVDLVFLDEAHEYANKGSAQSQAAQRLAELTAPTILLTGSLMNGYASSLFMLYWMTSGPFRDEFGRSEMRRFIRRFGFLEIWEPIDGDDRGTRSDRRIAGTRTKEAPGIHPSFVLDFLLRGSVVLHKADVEQTLPPITEMAEAIGCDEEPKDDELLTEYRRLERSLIDEVKETMRGGKKSPLLGALAQLPTYLDRATEDLGVYEVRYPDKADGTPGRLVHRARPLPADYVTPKERYLLDVLKGHVAAKLPTLVFLQNTGRPELPNRLLRLIQERVTRRCAFLDAKKVPTQKRQQWILDHVNTPGHLVLLVHPKAVSTGLNCLTRFCRTIWYQLGYESRTYRQANGRTHRIGQTRPVEVLVPYYAATAQAAQFRLMSAKLETALQVDGLDIRAALEAAGAGGDDRVAAASTLSIGEALYQAMTETSTPTVQHFQAAPVLSVIEPEPEAEPIRLDVEVPPPKAPPTGPFQLDFSSLLVEAASRKPPGKRRTAAKTHSGQMTLF